MLSFFQRKKRAVQHAMLVHFLLLLWAHKEVVLIKKKGPPQAGRALKILKLEITLVGDGSHLSIAVASMSGSISFAEMSTFEIKTANIHPT